MLQPAAVAARVGAAVWACWEADVAAAAVLVLAWIAVNLLLTGRRFVVQVLHSWREVL